MGHHLRLWHITFTMLLMLQVSCATTTITKVWKDDSFQALPVKNIYVVGLVPNPSVRKTFEDEFVKRLSARGLQATVSYSAIPFEKAADKSVLATQIKATGADTLLITRFIKREMVTTYIPGTVSALPYDYYYNWPTFVESTTGLVQGAPEVVKDDISFIETNVYDVATEKLIWSTQTETWMIEYMEDLIRAFSKIIIDKLASDRIIR